MSQLNDLIAEGNPNRLTHRGLTARVWFDADDMRFYAGYENEEGGRRQGLTVDGTTVDGLVREWREVVDLYLDGGWGGTPPLPSDAAKAEAAGSPSKVADAAAVS